MPSSKLLCPQVLHFGTVSSLTGKLLICESQRECHAEKASQGFRKNIAVQLFKGDSDNETLYPTETCSVFVVLLFLIKPPFPRSERK